MPGQAEALPESGRWTSAADDAPADRLPAAARSARRPLRARHSVLAADRGVAPDVPMAARLRQPAVVAENLRLPAAVVRPRLWAAVQRVPMAAAVCPRLWAADRHDPTAVGAGVAAWARLSAAVAAASPARQWAGRAASAKQAAALLLEEAVEAQRVKAVAAAEAPHEEAAAAVGAQHEGAAAAVGAPHAEEEAAAGAQREGAAAAGAALHEAAAAVAGVPHGEAVEQVAPVARARARRASAFRRNPVLHGPAL